MFHALPVSAAADGIFTLSDRTEARVRAPDPVTNAVALDVDTLMDARAVWTGRSATYTLEDLPRFTLLDFNAAAVQPSLLDSVIAAGEWHFPHVRIRVAENATYGQLSIESLSVLSAPNSPQPTPNPTGQPAPLPTATVLPPTTQSFLYGSSETSVASTLLFRPWILLARVGYRLSGGIDTTLLPLAQGPFAEANADYQVDGRDHLTTVATASQTSFSDVSTSSAGVPTAPASGSPAPSTSTKDLVLGLEEHWRRRWASKTDTMLGAGGYAASTEVADAPSSFNAGPIAEAELDQRFLGGANQGLFRADIRAAPLVNPLNGLLDDQIHGTIEGSWTHRRFRLRGFVSAGGSVHQGTSTADRVASAEIDAAYSVSEMLTFDGGLRALYTEQNGLGAPSAAGGTTPIVGTTLSQGVVFLAVTFRAVKARF